MTTAATMRPKKYFSSVENKMVRSPITQSYCDKVGYTNRKLAATVAAKQRKETGEPIYAYHCDRGCSVYHIGHRTESWVGAQDVRKERREV